MSVLRYLIKARSASTAKQAVLRGELLELSVFVSLSPRPNSKTTWRVDVRCVGCVTRSTVTFLPASPFDNFWDLC